MASTDPTEYEGPSPSPGTARLLWYYAPPILWMLFIFLASTNIFSAGNTGSFLRPILEAILPGLSEHSITIVHGTIRKSGHFTEYAILALLVARWFRNTTGRLARNWFWWSLLLVAVYSLIDEYHQSFVPSRTASIYDSMIDICGGLVMLLVIRFWTRAKSRG
jgi:VanZ family protein